MSEEQQEPETAAEAEVRTSREMLQEERYLWMARAFVVMLVLAAICDFVLLIALANVTPVMRVQPFYIETNSKEQQIISVSEPRGDTLNSDALQESFVRQYLMARFGIGSDLKELERRWGTDGPVFWMSSQSTYEAFNVEAQKLKEEAERNNFTRDVEIRHVNKRPHSSSRYDAWTAEIVLKDGNRASVKKEENVFVAELRVNFRPTQKKLKWGDRLKNPLGFVVLDFGLTRKSQK